MSIVSWVLQAQCYIGKVNNFISASAQDLSETEHVNGALHPALLFIHLVNSEFLKKSVHSCKIFFHPYSVS